MGDFPPPVPNLAGGFRMARVRGEQRVEPGTGSVPTEETDGRLWSQIDERRRDWKKRKICGRVEFVVREGNIAKVDFIESHV